MLILKAGNGADAIKIIKEYDRKGCGINIVFMDCNMPIMNGYDASRKIKSLYERGKIQKLPLICAITANVSE